MRVVDFVFVAGCVLGAAAVGLAGWRALDARRDRIAWDRLRALESAGAETFAPAMVAHLPGPARRYFEFAIMEGAPLRTVVEIEMSGLLGFGTKAEPNYRPMRAWQILAPPHGLVWRVRAGAISGSDGAVPDGSWTRFWVFGVAPLVRASGPDHHRSAFGRVAAEAAFWAPASLLPSEHVRWASIDAQTARAVIRYAGFEQAVDIVVGADGAPRRVTIQRWSNANPEKRFKLQPFGGDLSEFREFGGYRLPTRVEGGNHFGEAEYFPFFQAEVTRIRFPADDGPYALRR